MRWTLANRLTFARILAVPLFIAAFLAPWPIGPQIAAILFALASFTDWLDGWLARARDETTPLGRFLDPVADKLLVVSALVLLVARGWVPALAAIVIIGREIAISALREWLAHHQSRLAVSLLGKLKTAAQMIAIALLLWHEPIAGISAHAIGLWLLWLAVVLTLWSGLDYLRQAWQELVRV